MKIKQVLLLQLPVPTPVYDPVVGNVPLAAAFLKLYAERKSLQKTCQIKIPSIHLLSHGSDRLLLNYIKAAAPDLVGFTLYMWNIERSLYLAREIRAMFPGVQIILGGPEVSPDNELLAAFVAEMGGGPVCSASTDFPAVPGLSLVEGEGEAWFCDFLAGRSGALAPISLSEVFSPYLEKGLETEMDRVMFLETVRGCPHECIYCGYPKHFSKMRHLPFAFIERGLDWARQNGIKEVYFLDPTLNGRPHFEEFLAGLIRKNPQRDLQFFGEIRPEAVCEETARLLKKAGFDQLEVGVQSFNPAVLKNIQRNADVEQTIAGLRAMNRAGLQTDVDIMIGLPGDSLQSLQRTYEILKENRLERSFLLFLTSALPGTELRQRYADRITYMKNPPYYILQTETMATEEIKAGFLTGQKVLNASFEPDLALPVFGAKTHFVAGLCVQYAFEGAQPESQWPDFLNCLEQAAQPFNLLFSCPRPDCHAELLQKAVLTFWEQNPYSVLNIGVQIEPALSKDFLVALQQMLKALPEFAYLENYYYGLLPPEIRLQHKVYLLVPVLAKGRFPALWLEELTSLGCFLVWELPGTGVDEWIELLRGEKWFAEDYYLLKADSFDPKSYRKLFAEVKCPERLIWNEPTIEFEWKKWLEKQLTQKGGVD